MLSQNPVKLSPGQTLKPQSSNVEQWPYQSTSAVRLQPPCTNVLTLPPHPNPPTYMLRAALPQLQESLCIKLVYLLLSPSVRARLATPPTTLLPAPEPPLPSILATARPNFCGPAARPLPRWPHRTLARRTASLCIRPSAACRCRRRRRWLCYRCGGQERSTRCCICSCVC